MAGTKISALTVATTIVPSDQSAWAQSGVTKSATLDVVSAGVGKELGLANNGSQHVISSASGTPATSTLGANVTSVTFTGNDTRGKIVVVMSGALAANTKIATCTFVSSYGGSAPGLILLVNQTSGVGLTIVNFYVLATSTGVSFDLASDQALAAGTYTIDYIVLG